MDGALPRVLYMILDLYWWVVVIAVIATWLVQFGVLNIRNQFAYMVYSGLVALTEPVFRQIRRVLPPFGGIDLSPIIVLVVIFFLQSWLVTGRIL
jgi:YggT family protein